MRTAKIRDIFNDDAKPLSFVPVFAVVSTLVVCCRLPKIVEMGKLNNSMLHFPSHLVVELSLGNSPDPRFQNFLGEHASPKTPHPHIGALSQLKIVFLCVHLKNLTLRPCNSI